MITGAESTPSLAVAAGYFTTAPATEVASAVMFAGTVSDGAVVSATVIVKDDEALLPAASVAVTVTVVAPSGNVDPVSWL